MRRELIVGWPKSGTTALFFKVADSLPAGSVQKAFEPKSAAEIVEATDKQFLVTKVLITAIGFERFPDFAHYDRKIWIMRDPRDFLISRVLYGSYVLGGDDRIARGVLDCIRRKSVNPASVSLVDMLSELSTFDRELFSAATPESMARRLRTTVEFLREHRPGLFLFRYEDMIDGQWTALEDYLGRSVRRERQVPARWAHVARSRSYGDWRHWFTASDVDAYRDAIDPFLEFGGYERDWKVSECQEIADEHAVGYVRAIMNKERARLGLANLAESA